jgi:hypothetical protein
MTLDDDIDDSAQATAPVWAVFGDLMAGMVGAFVLILVFALGVQLDLAEKLKAVVAKQAEAVDEIVKAASGLKNDDLKEARLGDAQAHRVLKDALELLSASVGDEMRKGGLGDLLAHVQELAGNAQH